MSEEAIDTTVKMMRLIEDAQDFRSCREQGHPSFDEMHQCVRCRAIDPQYVADVLSGKRSPG